MTRALLGLGSNLGDRERYLREAIASLAGVTNISSTYETEPVGGPPQPWFLNGVLAVEWDHSPEALLDLCLDIEAEAGRERGVRWGPRSLDLDVLTVGMERRSSPTLEVPHPRLLDRAFVIRPLLDLGPRGLPFGVDTLLRARLSTAGQRCRLSGPWPGRCLL